MKPRVFVGSSSEGLEVAQAIQVNLDRVAEVTVWTDGIFSLSRPVSDSLEIALRGFDFGVFVMSPDDLVKSRGRRLHSPRDNVLFELGLFAGRLGIKRTFIVHPRGVELKFPSDLHGLATADYDLHTNQNLAASLGSVCTRIKIELEGIRDSGVYMRWGEFCELAQKLSTMLRRSPSLGGYGFDTIAGISRGGIVVADLLSRQFGGNVPVVSLWADRQSEYPETTFDSPPNRINAHLVGWLGDRRVQNIPIVDDISRSGRTIGAARGFGQRAAPDSTVRAAVLIGSAAAKLDSVDYCAVRKDTDSYLTPFSLLD